MLKKETSPRRSTFHFTFRRPSKRCSHRLLCRHRQHSSWRYCGVLLKACGVLLKADAGEVTVTFYAACVPRIKCRRCSFDVALLPLFFRRFIHLECLPTLFHRRFNVLVAPSTFHLLRLSLFCKVATAALLAACNLPSDKSMTMTITPRIILSVCSGQYYQLIAWQSWHLHRQQRYRVISHRTPRQCSCTQPHYSNIHL